MTFDTTHPFLLTYLKYVENTESPRLYHIWSALTCASAAMGRRCWLPSDLGNVWPNMYVALVGQPAMRKGAAINVATAILRETTKVKFAPNDTGGQRQGLIRALLETGDEAEDEELVNAIAGIEDKPTSFGDLAGVELGLSRLAGMDFDSRDPHSMFAAAGELNSFIGENNTTMLTFLLEMWDGGAYKYQLKNSSQTLTDALLSILAGTTPAQIAISMPPEAIGQGFTSRVVFVYGDTQHKRVARPTLDLQLLPDLKRIYSEIFHRMGGAFVESAAAATLYDDLYYRGTVMQDPRFLHYCDRRGRHLNKLSMALSASRGSMTIELSDMEIADKLLMLTEIKMPDALGEYGMTKLSAAKQRLLEFLRKSEGPIPINVLYGFMNRDMNQADFKIILGDLHAAKKLTMVTLQGVGQCVVATDTSAGRKAKRELGDIEDLLKSA